MTDSGDKTGTAAAGGGGQANSGNNNNNKNNNGRFNRGKKNNSKKSTTDAKSTKFEGRCADLKGHIFDCSGPTQADRYVVTKREIEEYIGRTYKYGNDTKRTLENGELYQPPVPPDPVEGGSATMKLIWQKSVEELVKRYAQNEQNLTAAYSLV